MDRLRVRTSLFFGAKWINLRFAFLVVISLTVWNVYYFNYGNLLSDYNEISSGRYIPLRQAHLSSQNTVELDTDLNSFDSKGRPLATEHIHIQGDGSIVLLKGENSRYRRRNEGREFANVDQRSYSTFRQDKNLESVQKRDELSYEPVSRINASSQESWQIACKELSLTEANNYSYGTCEPHKPTEAACLLAESLYQYDPSLSECKTNAEHFKICSFYSKNVDKKIALKAKCDRSVCDRVFNDIASEDKSATLTFGVYTVDRDEGIMKSFRNFSVISELESQLPRIARKSVENELNFVFVKCFSASNVTLGSQLLFIPPKVTAQVASKPRSKNTLNVNIVLLDSVSRPHFYRSLPETIETFRKWARNPSTSPAKVLDFELFQAVHGHTTHNEHALFTGELLPPFDPDKDTPTVGAEVLFGHFKRAGYQTMWQEDLCWTGGWGLMTDLYADDWEDLQLNKLHETFIDNTGVTHSTCEVLAQYGTESPFNGPEGDQICYNGKIQQEYFFQYSLDSLKAVASSQNVPPLFSFTALNVGHDDTGRRIQSIDSELARYVTATAHDQNTLTIILADHGNTYTEYTYAILEGRFEIFHPSLFVIVPNKVAALLGEEAMSTLEINQHRLVTMIDLHRSLIPLATPLSGSVKPAGLFAPISAARTCNDVELRTPNLCVCEGWDSPTTNDSMKISIVEFAVGELNNMAHAQFTKTITGSEKTYPVLRSCERLRPLRFENVRERSSKTDGALITSLDIYVKAGNVVNQKEDVFHVEVKSKNMPNQDSLEMELVQFDRLTLFGKYKKCADEGVNLKLCVCSKTNERRSFAASLKNVPWSDLLSFFNEPAKARSIDENECLFLVKRNHSMGKSVAFEIANTCPGLDFTLRISAELYNMKVSRKLPFEMTAPAGSISFAFSARIDTDFWEGALDVTADIVNTFRIS